MKKFTMFEEKDLEGLGSALYKCMQARKYCRIEMADIELEDENYSKNRKWIVLNNLYGDISDIQINISTVIDPD